MKRALVALGLGTASAALFALSACTHDFGVFEPQDDGGAPAADGALPHDGSIPGVDAGSDGSPPPPPVDAASCPPPAQCFTAATSCATGCAQTLTTCLAGCNNNGCRVQCRTEATTCSQACVNQCTTCTQSAGCQDLADCLDASRVD